MDSLMPAAVNQNRLPMTQLKTRRYDPSRDLKTEDDMAEYLEAALEDGHPAVVAAALGHIARAQGVSGVARRCGIRRENLYKVLSADGNPELATLLKIVRALGLRLHASAA